MVAQETYPALNAGVEPRALSGIPHGLGEDGHVKGRLESEMSEEA